MTSDFDYVLAIVFRFLQNVFRLITAPLWYLGHLSMRPRSRWVHVRLRSKLVEIEREVPFFTKWIPGLSLARPTSIALLRELVDYIVEDDRIQGVVFDIPPLQAGWATCHSLRELIERLRANDRHVVAYLSQGGGNRELYVASAASKVLASPVSQLAPLGLGASVTYFKGLLDKAGLEVEVRRRAEYKTAVEPVVREEMSEPQREQTEALLGTIDTALRDALRERAGDAGVEAYFDRALFSATDAVEHGLIDAVCYEDELPTWLGDDRKTVPVVRAPRYYAWHSRRLFRRILPERYVAVVPVHGAISGGSSGSRGGMKFASTVATIRAARRNPMVAGVVLHVDSPGGSALASDLIHREVERLKELKPVVACFGNVAASGGYYVAACADAVVAQPLTITGSIGVVSSRLLTEPLMKRLGVNVSTIRLAPHADLLQRPGALTEEEDGILDREIDAFYRAFVDIVARGRGRAFDEVEPLARGRVWSGVDAHERGLIDALGGLDEAVRQVKDRLSGKMGQGKRDALRPRLMRSMKLELPPAEPRRVGEEAAVALLSELHPEAGELLKLTRGGERVLAYASGLPEIR